jgi:Zn-dependent M28 family amino/carboxypeptidase
MRELVEALCSERCAGRATGSEGGRAARAIVVEALARAGLAPWEQPIPEGGANVVARVGTRGGPSILVGAHYDHLGRHGRDTYWGADDNAAAVAALVELAGALAAQPPPRDMWIVAFDAEEPPHFLGDGMGSQRFVDEPPLPLDDIDLMVCMDLVGHALGAPSLPREVRDTVFVFGAETSEGTAALVDGVRTDGLVARRAGINLLPPLSDYHPFRARNVPFLFLTGGRWRHYHTPADTPEKLDYAKIAATARWLEALVRSAAVAPGRRRFTDGRDDAATLRTLIGVARAIGHDELVLRAGQLLDALDGALSPAAFMETLAMLAVLEAALA